MILIDVKGHMVSTESANELHAAARKLGIKREWYHTPGVKETHSHYDLTTAGMRKWALSLGAKKVSQKDLMLRAWWAKGR